MTDDIWPRLLVGSKGPEVGNWQRFLNEQGITDWNGLKLVVDEAFGARTSYATQNWQKGWHLSPSGEVDDVERVLARQAGFIPFIQARSFNLIYPKPRAVNVIVIHTMESSEKPGTADAVARWFAGFQAPRASAHYCLDPENTVQCVRDADIAWHAPGCNNNGIGIEHAGRAAQTDVDWADDASKAILARSAGLAAKLARLYGIPVVKLSADDLKAGKSGFCGHVDATLAFPAPDRTHTDPGPHFNWQSYLEAVQKILAP